MGTVDDNGAGQNDILLQNTNGAVAVWKVSGTSIIASGSLGNPGPTWHVRAKSGCVRAPLSSSVNRR
jgi:hypothetical protein